MRCGLAAPVLARGGSKKWKPAGSTASRSARAGARGRRGSTRAVKTAPSPAISALLLALVPQVLGVDAGRVDVKSDVRIRAELLEHRDLDVDPRQRRIGEARVLEGSGPDPEDDRAARRRGPVSAERDPVAAELDRVAVEPRLDEVHRRRADEGRDEEVDRARVERLRRVDLLHPAVAHHGDALAERHRLDLVVRDVDGRRAEARVQAASSARMLTRSFASRLESGSSIRKASGSRTIARPIATRWRCPPESAAGRRSSSSSSRSIRATSLDALAASPASAAAAP